MSISSIKDWFEKYKKKFWPYTVFFGTANITLFLIIETVPYHWRLFLDLVDSNIPHEAILWNDIIALGILTLSIIILIRMMYKKIKDRNLTEASLDDIDI